MRSLRPYASLAPLVKKINRMVVSVLQIRTHSVAPGISMIPAV